MGFYGNITNTSRTSFQFDKIYPNRYTMDSNSGLDGVYIGRYVLIEYENEFQKDQLKVGYRVPDEEDPTKSLFGKTINDEGIVRFKLSDGITLDKTIIRIPGCNESLNTSGTIVSGDIHNQVNPTQVIDEFWIANGVDEHGYVTFNFVATESTAYTENYAVDTEIYGAGRGYDSTVWQKTVDQQGTDKYVMIAELNTVVPTFDIAADAPTIVPITPHFDADSTNVYYKLHQQSAWGLRLKAANGMLQGPPFDSKGAANNTAAKVFMSTNNHNYPSDETTVWTNDTYETDKDVRAQYSASYNKSENSISWKTDGITATPAAIYYNKDGFDSLKISYSTDQKNIDAYDGQLIPNEIQLRATGKSGHLYNTHDGTTLDSAMVDTQELSILLPALGDSIAEVWDIMYGGRETNSVIQATGKRNQDIDWESARGEADRVGLRLVGDSVDKRYSVAEINTVAGSINSMHDALGMIITADTKANLESHLDQLNVNRLYYATDTGIYYRKHKTYNYTPYVQTPVTITASDLQNGTYFVDYGDGRIVPATGEYDSSATYYENPDHITPVNLTAFDPSLYWYQDYTADEVSNDNPLKMDYIKDSIYHDGYKYFTNVPNCMQLMSPPLSNAYQAKLFYYHPTASSKDFILDESDEVTHGRTYYELDETKVKKITEYNEGLQGFYVPNKYWYLSSNGTYKLNTTSSIIVDDRADGSRGIPAYYLLDLAEINDGESVENVNNRLYIRTVRWQKKTINQASEYIKGAFYKTDDGSTPDDDAAPCMDDSWDNTATYWIKTEVLTPLESSAYRINTDKPLSLTTFYTDSFFLRYNQDPETKKYLEYRLITAEMYDPYTMDISSIYALGWENNIPLNISQQQAFIKQGTFYQPNEYHYLKNGSYLLDTYPLMTNGGTDGDGYYRMTATPTPVPNNITFYEPYTYYTYNETTGEYDLIKEEEMPTGTTIYKRDPLYVISDTAKVFEKGAEWNMYAYQIPETVTVGHRTEVWELVEVPEFSRKLNTMYGLILKINQYIEWNDSLTREQNIFQGALNKLNDIIANVAKMETEQFVVTDNYGRMHSADFNTLQKTSATQAKATGNLARDITGDKYNQVNTVNAMRGQWITIDIDPDVGKPFVTIHHNFQPVKDTTSTWNMNNDATAILDGEQESDNNIQLYTPIVDAMGHVVGKNTRTITLPYAFKIFNINNDDTDDSGSTVTTPGATGNIIAEIVQDTFNFNTGNKWLRFKAEPNSDKLTIYHKLHTPNATQTMARATNKNADEVASNSDNDKIVLHDIVFDAAGHMLEDHPHTYTLPYDFKFVTIGNENVAVTNLTHTAGTITAENTQDTLIINPGNTWIHMSVDSNNDTFSIGHLVRTFTSGTYNTDYGLTSDETITTLNSKSATFNVPMINFDEAGHIRKVETHTVTIPWNFDKYTVELSDVINTDSTEGIEDTIIPTVLDDEIKFKEGNRWINIEGDNDTQSLTFKHYVSEFSPTTSNSTLKLNNSIPTFDVPSYTYDRAGHITGMNTHTYTMPGIYNIIKDSSNATIEADKTNDTLTITADNTWLKTDVTTDTLTITHIGPNNINLTYKGLDTDITPIFGDSFNIPYIGIDELGHVSELEHYSITLPQGSLSQITGQTEGNVLVGLSFVPTTGAISYGKDYIGNLTLNGYTRDDTILTNTLNNTDTLNQALNKLEDQIATEVSNREDAINALDFTEIEATTGLIINTVSQEDGLINATTRSLVAADIPNIAISQVIDLQDNLDEKLTVDHDATTNEPIVTINAEYLDPNTSQTVPAETTTFANAMLRIGQISNKLALTDTVTIKEAVEPNLPDNPGSAAVTMTLAQALLKIGELQDLVSSLTTTIGELEGRINALENS